MYVRTSILLKIGGPLQLVVVLVFVTFHFTVIQRGVKFLLPVTDNSHNNINVTFPALGPALRLSCEA